MATLGAVVRRPLSVRERFAGAASLAKGVWESPPAQKTREAVGKAWAHKAGYWTRGAASKASGWAFKLAGWVPWIGKFRPLEWATMRGAGERFSEHADKLFVTGIIRSALRAKDAEEREEHLDRAAEYLNTIFKRGGGGLSPGFWKFVERKEVEGFNEAMREVIKRSSNPNFAFKLAEFKPKEMSDEQHQRETLEFFANAGEELLPEAIRVHLRLVPQLNRIQSQELREAAKNALKKIVFGVPAVEEYEGAGEGVKRLAQLKHLVAEHLINSAHGLDEEDLEFVEKILAYELPASDRLRQYWLSQLPRRKGAGGETENEIEGGRGGPQPPSEGGGQPPKKHEEKKKSAFDFLELLGEEKK